MSRKVTKRKIRSKKMLRAVKVGEALPNLTAMQAEILDMTDVLMGRAEPPIDVGTMTMMEVADAYFARGMEMTMRLQEGERNGVISKGSSHYKFRTGELRTFCEIAKRAADLGSRRITAAVLHFDQERYGRESA